MGGGEGESGEANEIRRTEKRQKVRGKNKSIQDSGQRAGKGRG